MCIRDRCQDEANGIGPALTSQINIANLQARQDNSNHIKNNNYPTVPNNYAPTTSQPRGDIALYLGDIQDHLLTMFQNLLAYEKIFSRSHTNYLAQLQVESFNSNNKVTEMLGKVTMIGTMLVPLNAVSYTHLISSIFNSLRARCRLFFFIPLLSKIFQDDHCTFGSTNTYT